MTKLVDCLMRWVDAWDDQRDPDWQRDRVASVPAEISREPSPLRVAICCGIVLAALMAAFAWGFDGIPMID